MFRHCPPRAGRRTAAARYLLLPALLAAVPAAAAVQEAPPGLTMERAVEAALAGHPDVLAAKAGIAAAAARRRQAEARPDPRLALGTGGLPFGLKGKEGEESEIELGLEQTIELSGKRTARIEVGRFDEDIAALQLERVRMVLAAGVRRAYVRVVYADEALARIARAAELLDRAAEAVQVQYASGRAAYADVLRARVDKARLLGRAIEERRGRRAAAAELNLLMGRAVGEDLRLASGLEALPPARTAEELKAAALTARPSIRIAALRDEQAAAAERLAGLNRRPDLEAGLYLPSKRLAAWGFSLGLTLPLSSKRWAGERAEAAAAREAGQASADGLRRRISAEVETAYESVLLAGEQARLFESRLLAEIEDELKVSLELYALGRVEAYALLDLHRAAAEARLEHLRAVYNGAMARIDLDVAGEDIL